MPEDSGPWWRWQVARLLDRLPGTCWASLVSWALGNRPNPWQPIDWTCRDGLERSGSCYCGKLRTADFDRHTAEALATANTTDADTCRAIWEASE